MVDLYTRQAELEYESVLLGQTRYQNNREDRGESETGPGREQTKRTVAALAEAIAEFTETAPVVAGRLHTAAQYLAHVLPEQAAYLTVRYVIDGAAGNQKLATVALRLASAIEDHVNLLYTKEEAPGLYKKVMEQVKTATTEHHRTAVLRHVMRKFKTVKLEWLDREKLILGTKLVELFVETTGLIEDQRNTEGHHDTPVRLVFTEATKKWLEEAHAGRSQWQPVHQPMVHPPRDWTTPSNGGYLTTALRRATLMQTRVPKDELIAAREQMGMVYASVNAIQRTPWKINGRVLAVMREARTGGERFQSLFVESDVPLPVRPTGVPTSGELTVAQRESMSLWKREAAQVYETNARLGSKRVAVSQKMWAAEKFADENAIYFPHYLDFRGRIYPYASYLNPQSDDVGRSLLEFAEGKPLGERGLYWIKVHVANLFGVDKVSFEDRVKWVNEHMAELMDSAAAPLDGQMFWAKKADSPWCALAAVMELTGAILARESGVAYVSHLPIAMDGSCSGLQHYSAMLRDCVGGAAVNLVPSSKPGDIYTEVANRAQDLINASHEDGATPWKGDKVVRKIAKQPTMTMCYSATVFGMQAQIARAVEGLGGSEYLAGHDVRQASVYAAGVVWDAIGETVVAAKEAMAFLKECAKLTNKVGNAICWTAPSGYLVQQGYRVFRSRWVKVHYKGREMQLALAEDSAGLDTKRQVAGVAPNFVHSLDSAHLMATVVMGMNNGLDHWACIHDSFGVHAADVDVLHACIREAFIEQYSPDVLERFRQEVIEQLPPELAAKVPEVPPKGSLDLAAVRESAYFFA